MRGFLVVFGLVMSWAAAAQTPQADPKPVFTYQEIMVPMRDGVSLQTVILRPVDRGEEPLPILLRRTPYGVPDKAPTEIPNDIKSMVADGYIFVMQNIRGRFKSEGVFGLTEDSVVDPGHGTIETRDAWDSIDWLVKNLPHNNGRVGLFGVSYSGYTSAAALLDPHPALKAISEQASPANQWMNDDDHRYGALRLSYDFEYAVMEEADKGSNTHFAFDRYDTYDWYLAAGPLSRINDKYVHGQIKFWNESAEHPDYDAFWKKMAWVDELKGSTVPNLNVAGFWDQEDPWGAWQINRRAALHDPDKVNLMVAGPWRHGGWNDRLDGESRHLGPIDLGQETGLFFRQEIEAPFFAYWLHDKGEKPDWAAKIFQTGSNQWRSYAAWPPKEAAPTSLYLHADGSLSFTAPGAAEKGAHRDYVSDPANPVPYRPRPISPTYPGGDWPFWEMGDQRFVDHRPDVLSFVSAPLDHDLTVSGEVSARIYAATSGTDGDLIVKLIDVFPEDAPLPNWPEDKGPPPGDYARQLNGYQLPIAMEVRRGRYLKSFEHPTPLTPNRPLQWDVPLRDRNHVFLKGHRIMVQIQSSWFPLIDRNPQKFVPNIFQAKAADFISARQRIYATPDLPSQIRLPVMP
jgi:putative CocE/NonD family hydrolase